MHGEPNSPDAQGISDTPAWVVAKAKTYARMSRGTPFVIYQGAWSVLRRDFERENLNMGKEEGEFSCPCVRYDELDSSSDRDDVYDALEPPCGWQDPH